MASNTPLMPTRTTFGISAFTAGQVTPAVGWISPPSVLGWTLKTRALLPNTTETLLLIPRNRRVVSTVSEIQTITYLTILIFILNSPPVKAF